MSYELSYIDGLKGAWIAQPIPTSNASIQPYSTGNDGGFAYQAPRQSQPSVGSPTAVLDSSLDAETYRLPSGARAWKPTASESSLVDSVTRNPYQGLDELASTGSRSAAGRGFQALPYVGDIVGGAVEGAIVYGRTGSFTHAALAGSGAALGGIAGTALGASIGAVGGPVGILAGGIVGGAIGSAFGSAAGQALANLLNPLPPANVNGLTTDGDIPFSGGQGVGILYRAVGTITSQWWICSNGAFSHNNTQTIGINVGAGPWARITVDNVVSGCRGWTAYVQVVARRNDGFAAVIGEIGTSNMTSFGIVNVTHSINFVRRDGLPDTTGNPPPTQIPYRPTPEAPVIPRNPRFRLPMPIPRPVFRPTARPTENPTDKPTREPIGVPAPAPRLPIFEMPGDYPTPQPHPDPYPDGDRPNPNPTNQPGDEPDGDCDPCKELAAIRAKLEETFSLAWALPECGEGFAINRNGEKEGQGLAGLSQKIDGLYQVLRVLHDNTRCDDGEAVLVTPEWWQVRPGGERPQLICVYGVKGANGAFTRERYQMTVPWFAKNRRKTLKALLPVIDKGSHQGVLTLLDNSKVIVYARSAIEAEQALRRFWGIVEISKRPPRFECKTGQIKPGTEFKKLRIHPIEARYFPHGQKDNKPLWVERLV